MKEIIIILISSCLIDNYPLIHYLGLGTVIENHTFKQKFIICVSIIVNLVICTIIIWPLNIYIIKNVIFLQNIVFTIIIILVSVLLNKFIYKYYKIDTMKILINGSILGALLHNTELSYLMAILTSFSIGVGILIVVLIFNCLYEKVDCNKHMEFCIKIIILSIMTLVIIALCNI